MNKILVFTIIYLASLVMVQSQSNAKLERNRHDFGKIERRTNKNVETTFKITNIGDSPLIIYKVDTSCGCISPDFTKQPIKKGESGYITLRLDVKQLIGKFNRTAFVKTNATKDKGVLLLRVTGVAE